MSLDLWLEIDDSIMADTAVMAALPSEDDFLRWAEAALAGANHHGDCSLDIRLVGASESQALNRDYRGKDKATNVLSFAAELPAELIAELDVAPLGDLAICADIVAQEAQEQGKALLAHWAHMTIHGVLHLLGHDHIEAVDAARMEPLEIAILATLGWDNPYDDEFAGAEARSRTPFANTTRELP